MDYRWTKALCLREMGAKASCATHTIGMVVRNINKAPMATKRTSHHPNKPKPIRWKADKLWGDPKKKKNGKKFLFLFCFWRCAKSTTEHNDRLGVWRTFWNCTYTLHMMRLHLNWVCWLVGWWGCWWWCVPRKMVIYCECSEERPRTMREALVVDLLWKCSRSCRDRVRNWTRVAHACVMWDRHLRIVFKHFSVCVCFCVYLSLGKWRDDMVFMIYGGNRLLNGGNNKETMRIRWMADQQRGWADDVPNRGLFGLCHFRTCKNHLNGD